MLTSIKRLHALDENNQMMKRNVTENKLSQVSFKIIMETSNNLEALKCAKIKHKKRFKTMT